MKVLLKEEFEKDYYKELRTFLISEYKTQKVYPPMGDIFNALKYSSYEDTKVVIIGQDPYHQEGQAHGLCFSVNKDIKIIAITAHAIMMINKFLLLLETFLI